MGKVSHDDWVGGVYRAVGWSEEDDEAQTITMLECLQEELTIRMEEATATLNVARERFATTDWSDIDTAYRQVQQLMQTDPVAAEQLMDNTSQRLWDRIDSLRPAPTNDSTSQIKEKSEPSEKEQQSKSEDSQETEKQEQERQEQERLEKLRLENEQVINECDSKIDTSLQAVDARVRDVVSTKVKTEAVYLEFQSSRDTLQSQPDQTGLRDGLAQKSDKIVETIEQTTLKAFQALWKKKASKPWTQITDRVAASTWLNAKPTKKAITSSTAVKDFKEIAAKMSGWTPETAAAGFDAGLLELAAAEKVVMELLDQLEDQGKWQADVEAARKELEARRKEISDRFGATSDGSLALVDKSGPAGEFDTHCKLGVQGNYDTLVKELGAKKTLVLNELSAVEKSLEGRQEIIAKAQKLDGDVVEWLETKCVLPRAELIRKQVGDFLPLVQEGEATVANVSGWSRTFDKILQKYQDDTGIIQQAWQSPKNAAEYLKKPCGLIGRGSEFGTKVPPQKKVEEYIAPEAEWSFSWDELKEEMEDSFKDGTLTLAELNSRFTGGTAGQRYRKLGNYHLSISFTMIEKDLAKITKVHYSYEDGGAENGKPRYWFDVNDGRITDAGGNNPNGAANRIPAGFQGSAQNAVGANAKRMNCRY